MNHEFHKKFGEEFLVSERLRTTILACVFFLGTIGSATLLIFFSNEGTDELHRSSLLRVLFFQLSLFVFEIMALLYIVRRIKKNIQTIPVAGQYLNVAIEMTAPAIVLFLLSQHYQTPGKVLHSPIVNIYFVLIILSTLRLNFKISFFAGLLAAVSFLSLSFYLINISANRAIDFTSGNEYIISIAKSVGLMVSGVGAAFV